MDENLSFLYIPYMAYPVMANTIGPLNSNKLPNASSVAFESPLLDVLLLPPYIVLQNRLYWLGLDIDCW
jgi:hypothetical protein